MNANHFLLPQILQAFRSEIPQAQLTYSISLLL